MRKGWRRRSIFFLGKKRDMGKIKYDHYVWFCGVYACSKSDKFLSYDFTDTNLIWKSLQHEKRKRKTKKNRDYIYL